MRDDEPESILRRFHTLLYKLEWNKSMTAGEKRTLRAKLEQRCCEFSGNGSWWYRERLDELDAREADERDGKPHRPTRLYGPTECPTPG